MEYLKNLEAVAILSARMSDAAKRNEHPSVRRLAEMCCDQLEEAESTTTSQPFSDLVRERKAELILQTLKNDAMTRQALDPGLCRLELQRHRTKIRDSQE
jgi:hypothetical protein